MFETTDDVERIDLSDYHPQWFADVASFSDHSLIVHVGFRLHDGHDDEEDPALLALADYELVYDVTGPGIDEDDLPSFAYINSVFNAWPYWRAHVQGLMSQMGLRYVVPVFKVPAAVLHRTEETDQPTSQSSVAIKPSRKGSNSTAATKATTKRTSA